MTCAELDDRAIDHLYGELAPAARAEVEAHLAGCDACRRELGALERTLGVTREALRGPLAHEPPARVRALVQAEAVRAAARMAGPHQAVAPADGHSAWAWLAAWWRRPWFLPAVASFSVIALFFLGKQAFYDAPKRVLDRVEWPAEVEPPAAAPAAPVPVQSAYEPQQAPPPVAASPTKPGAVKEEAKRESAPARRRAPSRPASPAARAPAPDPRAGAGSGAVSGLGASANRWASPPPPVPASAPAGPAAAAAGASPRPVATAAPSPRPAAPARARLPKDDIEALVERDVAKKSKAAEARADGVRAEPPPPAAAAPAELAAPAGETVESEDSAVEGGGAGRAAEAPLPLAELQRRANLAFQQGRWERAARDYRELLRRFPDHRDATLWRRRLDLSIQNR